MSEARFVASLGAHSTRVRRRHVLTQWGQGSVGIVMLDKNFAFPATGLVFVTYNKLVDSCVKMYKRISPIPRVRTEDCRRRGIPA